MKTKIAKKQIFRKKYFSMLLLEVNILTLITVFLAPLFFLFFSFFFMLREDIITVRKDSVWKNSNKSSI